MTFTRAASGCDRCCTLAGWSGSIIRTRPSPGQIQNVAELAQRTPEVVECHRVTGEDCYVMRAYVRDVLHLEEVIDRFTVLGQTTTSIMQSSPVPGRPVSLDGGPPPTGP